MLCSEEYVSYRKLNALEYSGSLGRAFSPAAILLAGAGYVHVRLIIAGLAACQNPQQSLQDQLLGVCVCGWYVEKGSDARNSPRGARKMLK